MKIADQQPVVARCGLVDLLFSVISKSFIQIIMDIIWSVLAIGHVLVICLIYLVQLLFAKPKR